jgi:hypothetical protein
VTTSTKLNQIIAIEKGVKGTTSRELTDLYHTLQKPTLLSGISRAYQPRDDDGEQLPAESTRVQVTCDDILKQTAKALTRLLDVTAAKDWTNTRAKANVVVDGHTLIENAPVPYLLFLEKQLTDLHTAVSKLPTLDPAENWSYDAGQDIYRTDPVQTLRTKKVPRNHVKAEATDRHPAQVEVFYEDVTVGTWTKIGFSGALPLSRVTELQERIEKLQRAVKFAREEANGTEVTDVSVGTEVFGYLFG